MWGQQSYDCIFNQIMHFLVNKDTPAEDRKGERRAQE